MDKVKFIYGIVRQVLQTHGVLNQTLQEKIVLNVLYYIFYYLNEMRKEKKEKCVVIVVERDKDGETKVLEKEVLFVDDYFKEKKKILQEI